ncbi:hypothetical protein BGZ99_009113 [Dissophora globulifera]|uniref:DUF676 domain-containing protein n=1 Tax=Dissophora globulifera TaxID=979702 RepID=A0A9P6RTI6_9FUNG|nr:hypothetical protein BGZ99_009113 [Dissophora globulifera]
MDVFNYKNILERLRTRLAKLIVVLEHVDAAVKAFAEWTQQQVKAREEFNIKAYGARREKTMGADRMTDEANSPEERIPPVYVCFIGHSMGGLVAADAALMLQALPRKSPVVGILAFDTPYFGLNHTIFTKAAYERVTGLAEKATGAYALASAYLPAAAAWGTLSSAGADAAGNKRESREYSTNQQPSTSAPSSSGFSGFNPSSLWSSTSAKVETEKVTTTAPTSKSSKWGWGSVALGVGAVAAVAGAAYMANSHVNKGMEYITSHVQFVGTLWNDTQLKQRMAGILQLPIGFHCFYTQVQIPASSSNNWKSTSRTFIELSAIPEKMRDRFSARECSGQDEIEAHMEMFNPAKNYDCYQMGDETVRRIQVMVEDALRQKP